MDKNVKVAIVLSREEFYSQKRAGALAIWTNETYSVMEGVIPIIFHRAGSKKLGHLKTVDISIIMINITTALFSFSKSIKLQIKHNIYPIICALVCRVQGTEIIHVQNRPMYCYIIKKVFPKSKILLHLHNDHFLHLSTHQVKQVVKCCEKIVSVSNYIKSRVDEKLKDAGVSSHKSMTIYSGTNIHQINSTMVFKEKIKILFTGRLIEEKGVLELIKAFNNIPEDIQKKAELIVVGGANFGSNEETEYIKVIKREAKSNESIKFTGPVNHLQIIQFLENSNILVVPSTWNEPFGLVVTEGMSSGKCIVASNKGGIPEILGDAGLLIDPYKIEEFSAVLTDLIGNKTKIMLFGKKARKRAEEKFSWQRVANEFEILFKEAF